ncbi:TonB-dependent receptor domain-containing protein [Gilvimarinus sp. DA14]|uniref:TonB-dependent receptor domain-containing protein n=1 Tax=Gilvimarinus sp. DA14 TaxID=2956798 RepID=UPI0020B66D31|nr:TonB-dependent receptor [Gilvimarinus sp. DA14]UTF61537.1 TonB-dependent receptor [Gilvimarinus sp. DA14]
MQRPFNSLTKLSPLALAIALAPNFSLAQSEANAVDEKERNKNPKEIEELVVIGEPVDSLLTSADLDRKQANDLDDIFAGVPTVLVGGSVGAAQKIYVRNLGEDTLNISVDGATQSGVTYHHTGRISVEPELLKQVHVQVGAGDATSGPGALGGAIKFETKDPEDLLGNRNFGGILKAGYFSNTEGYKGSGTLFGRLGDTFSAMASYVTSDQDDMEDPNGNELPGTNSDQDLGFVKLVGDFGGGHKASVSYENLTEEGEKLTRPEWGEGPRNPLRDLEFDRKTTTVNYSWDKPNSDWLLLDVSLYNTDFEIYRPWDDYTSAVDTQGFLLSNTSQVGDHKIVYGSDYRDDEVTAGERAVGGNVYTETSDVLGFFVQDHFQATDALLLTFGTRWDDFNAVDKENNEFTSDGFSPNVGFAYDITRDLTFSGGYAEALRGVETNDGFKLFGTTNDPDLKAERAKNFELGLDYTLGAFLLSAGYHDTTIEDAIGNAVPWSRHYENLGELETNGYSLGATYNGERLFSKWTYVDTDVELDGEALTRYSYGYLGTSTGNTLTMDTSYQVSSSIDVGWIMTLVQDLDDIYVESADALISKPGYNVHDVYAHWEPSGLRGFSVTLTVKNVFDEEYLDHGSVEDFTHLEGYTGIKGYPAPGQDIRLSMALRF